MVRFHNQIGQQFLAGRIHFLAGFGFTVGFERHADMATDAYIRYTGKMEVFHVVDHCFALRIKEFAVWHDVDFGDEFHGGKVEEEV